MTKSELLDQASQDIYGPSGIALDFAKGAIAEQAAAERYARASAAAARWTAITNIVVMSAFLATTLGLLGYIAYLLFTGASPVKSIDVLTGFMGSLLVGAISAILASGLMLLARELAGYPNDAKWLAPLAGTGYCVAALEVLQNGGPSVIAWRDLALAERNQLLMFDYEIMNSLRRVFDATNREIAEKTQVDAACRALHGLPAEQAA